MSILKTAIAAGRWDLAAHALVYATIQTIQSGEQTDESRKREKTELIQERKTCYASK